MDDTLFVQDESGNENGFGDALIVNPLSKAAEVPEPNAPLKQHIVQLKVPVKKLKQVRKTINSV